MNKLRCLVLIGMLALTMQPCLSQELEGYTFQLEQLFEQLAEQSDDEIDYTEWMETMEHYRANPLNLNAVTQAELKKLFILNDFQIAVLIDYRSKQGPIRSIYELAYLPGYREEDIQHLKDFVHCKEVERANPKLQKIAKYSRHQLLMRYQRVPEEQEGYRKLSDSVLLNNPDKNRYLGSPDKLYCRYTFDALGSVQGGILMEKDYGEEFFQGSNNAGFDFYSASLGYTRKNFLLREVVVGDYHLRAGQGLLLWSSYAFGKTSSLMSLSRNADLLRVNRSVEENRFLRGAAITVGRGPFQVTGFASNKKIDASLPDSGIHQFESMATTGYHATPGEIEKENSLGEQLIGGVLQYKPGNLHLGVQALHHHYNKQALPKDNLYQAYSFTGTSCTGVSADYRYMAGRIQVFGETSWSNKALATLNGALLYLTDDLNLGLLHRNYSEHYYSYWANAFTENSSTANEEGYYFGLESRMANHQFKLFADVFMFPWLRYRVNAPSEGYEFSGEWMYSTRNMNLMMRYKHEQKPLNYQAENNLYELANIRKEYLKLLSDVPVGPINLRNRFEYSRVSYHVDSVKHGFFISQDAQYNMIDIPITIIGQLAWFRAEDYNNRFYVYERDVLYAGRTQMYYGNGWRFMGIIRWQASDMITLWLKFGQSRYPKEATVGSGLNMISGNHRSEVKAQVRWKF